MQLDTGFIRESTLASGHIVSLSRHGTDRLSTIKNWLSTCLWQLGARNAFLVPVYTKRKTHVFYQRHCVVRRGCAV